MNKHVKGTNTYKHTQTHTPKPEGHKTKTCHIHKTKHTENQRVHKGKNTNIETMQTQPETSNKVEHTNTSERTTHA